MVLRGVRAGSQSGVVTDEVRKIARYHRGLNIGILLMLLSLGLIVCVAVIGNNADRAAGEPPSPVVLPLIAGAALLYIAGVIGGLVDAIRLTHVMSESSIVLVAIAVILIMVFMPCGNILVLLVLNHRATTRLRDAGLRVGLLGAKVPKDA